MVLQELGGKISSALQQMTNATTVNQKVFDKCLNEIARALLQNDVQVETVGDLQSNIKRIVNLDGRAEGHNKRKIIQQAVFSELCKMLDPGKPSFTPKKNEPSVVMFVGLQGSGKTTTCTKYAHYYQNKGWKPALVCADTFRAGAFDQLKQNATKANIPFYGSHTESDPVNVAVEGVETFKRENRNLIIIDTSGRHVQEKALFEEMLQLREATKPDLVIFVMDSSIGQAAFKQAQAFKQSVDVGAVIVTKMDGHAKGGGALSAVAATKSPVVFIGTGEHINEFEDFNVKPFVSRLLERKNESQVKIRRYLTMMDSMTNEELGSTDLKLMKESRIMRIARGAGRQVSEVFEMFQEYKRLTINVSNMKKKQGITKAVKIANELLVLHYAKLILQKAVQMDHQKRLVGNYTMRNMYEHIQDVLFNQMEPGSSRKVQPEGRKKVAYAKITKYLRIMDSMTDEELDTTDQKLMNKSRIERIARGSGCQVTEVEEMFRFKPFFSHYLDALELYFKVLRMIMPGFCEERNRIKYKRYLAIMNSMTNEELDNLKLMKETRIMRIARGAGYQVT
ncbi:Signal recognition particle 54 kDa protein 2 [Artemisia annua]|uniref:signal-recognition-particle GTPase n=1 Tax=Artemisia annua TaxID=35608 RepID=A0A2U1M9L2_ARTAN|nr:Signal recognition particle 54 kDa protein 2 [Artemisia annua]